MRTIILDPNLDGTHGHHALYDRVIAREFKRRGVEAVILAHERFADEILDGTPVKGLFQTTAYRAFSKDSLFGAFDDVEQGNQAILEELSAVPAEYFKSSDLVVVHTVSEITLPGLVTWIATLPAAERPCFCIFLMLPAGIGEDEAGAPVLENAAAATAYREAFRVVREQRLDVHFFGSGPQHARQFSTLAGLNLPAHPILTAFDETPPEVEPSDDRVLLFAGDAKLNKGVHHLPGLVKALCPAHPELQFVIHANPEPAWGRALEVVRELEAIAGDHPNLKLELAPLPARTYADLLGSAAVTLLPYDRTEYRRKSSGVVWESIASKSTLVVPSHTWLDAECRLWGASHECYEVSEPEAMAEAVERAVRAGPDGRGAAASRFAAANGVKALVDQLADRWMIRGSLFSSAAAGAIRKDATSFKGTGWHELETAQTKPVRWCAAVAAVREALPAAGPWEIMFKGVFSLSEEQVSSARIAVDGVELETRWTRAESGVWTLAVDFTEEDAKTPAREITLKPGWTLEDGDDPRPLGLLTEGFEVRQAEPAADGPRREAPVPVSAQAAPGPDGWTEPLTAASFTARSHADYDLTLSFAIRAAGAPLEPDALVVLVNGHSVQPDWRETGDGLAARLAMPAPPRPVWESLDLDIVSAGPVALKMEALEWRPAQAACEPEPPASVPEPEGHLPSQRISEPQPGAAKIRAPIGNIVPYYVDAAAAAVKAGLEVHCVEDRSDQEHASITLQVREYSTGGQIFGEMYVKLLRGLDYLAVDLRENDGALALLRGVNADMIDVDRYGGFVRIFVDLETGLANPNPHELAANASALLILLSAISDLLEQGRVVGGPSTAWTEDARAIAAIFSGPEKVEVHCVDDSSLDENSSITFALSGFALDGPPLPPFKLKFLAGDDYFGLELREQDRAFRLLPGLGLKQVERDDWGGYVRFFVNPRGGELEPSPSSVAQTSKLLGGAVQACLDEMDNHRIDGLEGSAWLDPVSTVARALAGEAVVSVSCAEDRSGESHASITLHVKGLEVDDRTLPPFFIKLIKGEGYSGVELRENDRAFVLVPGLDVDEAGSDEWGRYVRFFADAETGKLSEVDSRSSVYISAALAAIQSAAPTLGEDVMNPWSDFIAGLKPAL